MKRKSLPPLKTREQTARALAERAENERAAAEGRPLPYPNFWDELDPTKVPRDATDEQIHQSYVEFRARCHRKPRKRYAL